MLIAKINLVYTCIFNLHSLLIDRRQCYWGDLVLPGNTVTGLYLE